MDELVPYGLWEFDVFSVLREEYGLVRDPEDWPQLTFKNLHRRGFNPSDAVWMYLTGRL